MLFQNETFHVYTQTVHQKTSYVFAIANDTIVLEKPRETIRELVPELMEEIKGYKGRVIIHWEAPERIQKNGLSNKVASFEKRKEFADALPKDITINLE